MKIKVKLSLWLLLVVGVIVLSLQQAGMGGGEIFNPGGLELLGRFWQASLHPDLSYQLLQITFQSTLTTLAYAVCGTFLSVIFGIVAGIFASEVWWWAILPYRTTQRSPWLGIRAILAVPRAIHEMLWGLFFVNIWGLDPLSAIGAIALPFGAITAKVFSEILDETPRQPLRILLNSGANPLNAFCYTLLPQAFPNLLSYIFYRFECSIRSAAVLGIIGAGGLGYQILLSLQSLRYEQLWTFFFALVILNGSVDFASAWLRHRLGCANRLDLNLNRQGKKLNINYQGDPIVLSIGLFFFALIPFCFWYVQPQWSKLWSLRSLQLFTEATNASFPLSITLPQLQQLLHLANQTLVMSILAIAIAASGGILLSFPASHNFFIPGGLLNPGNEGNWWTKLSYLLPLIITRIILLICRAIPAPIWALVALFIMFPGILPGAIALGIHNLGILGRLMAEVTENLEKQPLQALKGQGTPAASVFLYGVLPTTLPRFLAYILYRWEVCLRETVIVGLVGAGGLGRLLSEQMSSFDASGILTTISCLIVLTFIVDYFSSVARRALR